MLEAIPHSKTKSLRKFFPMVKTILNKNFKADDVTLDLLKNLL